MNPVSREVAATARKAIAFKGREICQADYGYFRELR